MVEETLGDLLPQDRNVPAVCLGQSVQTGQRTSAETSDYGGEGQKYVSPKRKIKGPLRFQEYLRCCQGRSGCCYKQVVWTEIQGNLKTKKPKNSKVMYMKRKSNFKLPLSTPVRRTFTLNRSFHKTKLFLVIHMAPLTFSF